MNESGHTMKFEGMERAKGAFDIQNWKEAFYETVLSKAQTHVPFTSEDIIQEIGLPRGDVETNANNAVGALMNAAATKGIIVKTGNRVLSHRPTSHAAELTEWVGP